MKYKEDSDKLKELMNNAGLSRRALIELTKVPYSTVRDWELGLHVPPNLIYSFLKLYISQREMKSRIKKFMEEL